jgi:hypothetical protein
MSFNESSLEFDLFESMRLKLARVIAGGGRGEIEAERIALYVMQGVREVPRLLNALASINTPEDETRNILKLVLDNVVLLERARAMLAGQDVPEDIH